MQIRWKIGFSVTPLQGVRSLQNFAHATWSLYCDLYESRMNFKANLNYDGISFVKWATGLGAVLIHVRVIPCTFSHMFGHHRHVLIILYSRRHICFAELCRNWLSFCFISCLSSSHHLDQCWFMIRKENFSSRVLRFHSTKCFGVHFGDAKATVPHYNDVIMSAMASQIAGVLFLCSSVCSGADQRKHQISTFL